MGSWPINPFDAAIYLCLFVAVVMGFMTGLLRSLATIFGYVAAMGLAVALAPQLSPLLTEQFKLPPAQPWLVFAVVFLVAGIVLGALLRLRGQRTGRPATSAFRTAWPARCSAPSASACWPWCWCWCSTASFRPAASRPS